MINSNKVKDHINKHLSKYIIGTGAASLGGLYGIDQVQQHHLNRMIDHDLLTKKLVNQTKDYLKAADNSTNPKDKDKLLDRAVNSYKNAETAKKVADFHNSKQQKISNYNIYSGIRKSFTGKDTTDKVFADRKVQYKNFQ